jgi:hypothetical protein
MVDQGEKRFRNFVLMIGDEVIHEMQDDLFKTDSDLKDNLKDPTVISLMKIAVVKTMVNLQTKNAYTKPFMAHLVGKKVMKELEE